MFVCVYVKLIRARAPQNAIGFRNESVPVHRIVVTTKTQDDNSHKIDYNITGETHATILCGKMDQLFSRFAVLCECAGRQTKDVLAEKMGFNAAVCVVLP